MDQLAESLVHIICGARPSCGFRVHDRYYVDKPRFAPGVCARCSGPIILVEPYTNTAVIGYKMSIKPDDPGRPGSIIEEEVPA